MAVAVLHSLSWFEGALTPIVQHGAIGFLLNMAKVSTTLRHHPSQPPRSPLTALTSHALSRMLLLSCVRGGGWWVLCPSEGGPHAPGADRDGPRAAIQPRASHQPHLPLTHLHTHPPRPHQCCCGVSLGCLASVRLSVWVCVRRDTAATMIQRVAKAFIVKKRLTTIRSKLKDKLIMPDIQAIKDSTRFPMISFSKK